LGRVRPGPLISMRNLTQRRQGAEEKKNSHKRAQRTQKEQRAKRQDEQSISLDYVVDGEF